MNGLEKIARTIPVPPARHKSKEMPTPPNSDAAYYFFARSFSKFFSSAMNSCTSLKSIYTEANRT